MAASAAAATRQGKTLRSGWRMSSPVRCLVKRVEGCSRAFTASRRGAVRQYISPEPAPCDESSNPPSPLNAAANAAPAAPQARAAGSGALDVHAFDHPATLAGQGTLALELDARLPDLDTVLVSVGGGGFVGGIAAWLAGRVKEVAVEPARCPTLHRALRAGEPVDDETGGLAADSPGCRRVGGVPLAVLHPAVSDAMLVADQPIREARRSLRDTLSIVAEPGGATAFAALAPGACVCSPRRADRRDHLRRQRRSGLVRMRRGGAGVGVRRCPP
ncbi:pyridoxal-phosphate dependent enzyme [Burkholderia plantarii]|uniref:pyridoxal-phosphate dependent enzyme n=1 Tax=Burkholderia plantarii TaxID=41899 RepID=UPI00272C9518|nr:pyridoxal-phosphate dependent enzyme [Burkholderia plantarii]